MPGKCYADLNGGKLVCACVCMCVCVGGWGVVDLTTHQTACRARGEFHHGVDILLFPTQLKIMAVPGQVCVYICLGRVGLALIHIRNDA